MKSELIGMDLVVVSYPGICVLPEIIESNRDKIEKRFAKSYLKEKENETAKLIDIDVAKAIDKVLKNKNIKVGKIMEMGKGGFLAALWDFLEEESVNPDNKLRLNNGLGCEYELLKVPMTQFACEISEILNYDPLRLRAFASYIVATQSSYAFIRELAKEDVKAECIGTLTDGFRRVRIDAPEDVFLIKEHNDPYENLVLSV